MAFCGYPKYVCVEEKKARAEKKLSQLKKKQDVRPVIIQGSAIARTWWAKSWNQNLERYADYGNRIGRGRSYVRHGAVLDLQINAGEIKSLVQGSRAKPYAILIKIKKMDKKIWEQITSSCAGMLDSLQELLTGNFPKALGEIFMQRDSGLFPSPKEISFACSCPDWASMCKHVAAALYGVGVRLDEDPTLFFTLRGVDTKDLVSRTVSSKAESLLEKASRKSSRIIAESDLSGLFGIDLTGSGSPPAVDGDPWKKSRLDDGEPKTGHRKSVKSRTRADKSPAQGVKPEKTSSLKKGVVKKRVKKIPKATAKKRTKGKEVKR